MAIYFLNIKSIGRATGASAVGAAAYRAGERIRDERTGRMHDHTDRLGVLHTEIVLPAPQADLDLSWARDRASLWNSAEAAESRKNARVAREYLVALPPELGPREHVALVRSFSQELADRYEFAVDVAVHAPREYADSDPRNYHAHLLATTRTVTSAGLGGKTALEWSDSARREAGLGPGVNEFFHVCERWATVANQALAAAQVETRIDHRTLAAQGIEREPKLWIPRVPYELERNGYRSFVADSIRQDHAQRLAAYQERTAALQAVAAPDAESQLAASAVPRDLDGVRRAARESWLRMREEAARGQARGDERTAARMPDDDYSR